MAMNPNPNHLPEEILIEIFSRVPSKSVGKFRCLSKPWRSLLSTPNFIKSHLTHQTHKRNLLLITPAHSLHTIATFEGDEDSVSKKVNLSNTWSAVVGSCNGLVLLLDNEGNMILVNPVTREQVNIPDSPFSLALLVRGSYRKRGFGYDSSTDDYKIVTISHYPQVGTFVDVYSVKSRVWRRLDLSLNDHFFRRASSAFYNGALHWLAANRSVAGSPAVILAFDLAHEEFYEIPAPDEVKEGNNKFMFPELVVLAGFLCIVDTTTTQLTGFQMSGEYWDMGTSWTRLCVSPHNRWNITTPWSLIVVEEVAVWLCLTEYLVVYNFQEDHLTTVVVDGDCIRFTGCCSFTESLVSPHFGNEIEDNFLL